MPRDSRIYLEDILEATRFVALHPHPFLSLTGLRNQHFQVIETTSNSQAKTCGHTIEGQKSIVLEAFRQESGFIAIF